MRKQGILFLLLCGCASAWHAPADFIYAPFVSGDYTLATYQRLSDTTSPIHIYIEGDGNSFDARGIPTSDPTPNGTLVRDMAARDASPNVAYIARPCQYIMSPTCSRTDWTDGRFSERIVDSISGAIQTIAQNRPVVLIGHSGGAMISGLVINRAPELNVTKWVTVAGVLNHTDWTSYFGDAPLSKSLDMSSLPTVPQTHYIIDGDRVVPNRLSRKWVDESKLAVIQNAKHDKIPEIELSF